MMIYWSEVQSEGGVADCNHYYLTRDSPWRLFLTVSTARQRGSEFFQFYCPGRQSHHRTHRLSVTLTPLTRAFRPHMLTKTHTQWNIQRNATASLCFSLAYYSMSVSIFLFISLPYSPHTPHTNILHSIKGLLWHWSTAHHVFHFSNKLHMKASRGIFTYSAAGSRPAEAYTHMHVEHTHTSAQAIIISIHLVPLSPSVSCFISLSLSINLYSVANIHSGHVCLCARCDPMCHVCLLHMNKTWKKQLTHRKNACFSRYLGTTVCNPRSNGNVCCCVRFVFKWI